MWRRGLRSTIFVWLMSVSVAPIASAHCFSIWNYRSPQHCSARGSTIHRISTIQQPEKLEKAEQTEKIPEQTWTSCTEHCVGWPSLEAIDWGTSGDERLKAIALFHALMDAP
jgi:hypothetical protein